MRYMLIKCSCGFSFGSTKLTDNYCTKCGSFNNQELIESFESADKLAKAISLANIPSEISAELLSKLNKKESKKQNNLISNQGNLGLLSILKKSTNKEGILTMESLEKYLLQEGLIQTSSEYLIGQAEVQGYLIRVSENTWNWLS